MGKYVWIQGLALWCEFGVGLCFLTTCYTGGCLGNIFEKCFFIFLFGETTGTGMICFTLKDPADVLI